MALRGENDPSLGGAGPAVEAALRPEEREYLLRLRWQDFRDEQLLNDPVVRKGILAVLPVARARCHEQARPTSLRIQSLLGCGTGGAMSNATTDLLGGALVGETTLLLCAAGPIGPSLCLAAALVAVATFVLTKCEPKPPTTDNPSEERSIETDLRDHTDEKPADAALYKWTVGTPAAGDACENPAEQRCADGWCYDVADALVHCGSCVTRCGLFQNCENGKCTDVKRPDGPDAGDAGDAAIPCGQVEQPCCCPSGDCGTTGAYSCVGANLSCQYSAGSATLECLHCGDKGEVCCDSQTCQAPYICGGKFCDLPPP